MSERLKEWLSFRDDADTKTYVIAGVAGVAIVASLWFVFSGLFGGGSAPSIEEQMNRTVKFYCTQEKKVFEVSQKDLFADMDVADEAAMMDEPPHIKRVMCPACNKKTGVAMVRCPNEECKQWYCPDWWQKSWSKTQYNVQKPLICPHCKTDYDKYFIEKMKNRRR